jgi:hypothetical protein
MIINTLSFWPQIRPLILKSYTMKTLINALHTVLASLNFQKEQMPALIPVRVVTKVPNQHQ